MRAAKQIVQTLSQHASPWYANYTLLDTTATTTANITPLGIMVTASGGTRMYDGTTIAPVRLASIGVLAGDSVSFSGNSQFADKNVGTAKPVTVSAITATGAMPATTPATPAPAAWPTSRRRR